jgi:hypothetical protein
MLNDGRKLAWAEYGQSDGKAVFVFHGTRGRGTKSMLPDWNLLQRKVPFRCESSYRNVQDTGCQMQKREEHFMIGARTLKH